MTINIGDIVRIKKYVGLPGKYTSHESPARKTDTNYSGSAYYIPERQGKTGLVTSISRGSRDDTMWVPPTFTLLMEDETYVSLLEEDLIRIIDDKKPLSFSGAGLVM